MSEKPRRDGPSAQRRAELCIDQTRTHVTGRPNHVLRGGQAHVGAEKHGAVGGDRTSIHNVLAGPLVTELAIDMGKPEREVRAFLEQVGKTIQNRLLHGMPSGIPFVGVIGVVQQHFSPEMLANRRNQIRKSIAKLKLKKANGWKGWKTLTPDQLIAGAETSLRNCDPFKRRVVLHQPTMLRRYFSDNVAYNACIKDHARTVRIQHAAERHRDLTDSRQLRRRLRLAQEGRPLPPKEDYEQPTAPIRRRYAVA